MDRRTFRTILFTTSVIASFGLTACNDTGFVATDFGQKELDKLNPKATPTPSPTPTVTPSPTPTVTPSPTPTVTPSPTPTVTPSPTPTVVPPKATQDKFNVPAADVAKADLLFCVDNSGSMDGEQKILADSMNTFIGLFAAGGVDYHLGLVTTDVTTSNWSSKLPNYVTPARGRLLSRYSERFLTKNTSNVVEKFKANAKVGTSGDGYEQCFNSILYALEDQMLGIGGFNEGFLRDDALLSIIVVSDENEDIRNGETVADRIDRMKKRVAALRGPNSRGSSFHFVIDLDAKAPSGGVKYPLGSSINSYPDFYLKAADALVGKTYNIKSNFGTDMAKIGSDIVTTAQSEFKLANKPNPVSSIVVKLDGKVVAADPADGYVYDASKNAISLKGATLRASPGGILTIDYTY